MRLAWYSKRLVLWAAILTLVVIVVIDEGMGARSRRLLALKRCGVETKIDDWENASAAV